MTVYNKASLVLAESPAYKAGKIQPYYPLTPDVSFDFTRATSATRVNASGNIEKETQNLLLQSNQFDTTWDNSSVITLTSGQPDKDGGTSAWELEKGAASSFLYQSVTTSGINTFSLYAKANTTNWIMFQVSGIANVRTFFDLGNGVLGSSLSNVIDAKIELVGSGWYRCSFSYNGNAVAIRVFPADANNDTSGTSGSIYIQDAQLEQGLVARNYQETTTTAFYGGITDNIPRLDYTDSSCPSVLLEPQRTNLIPHSEYFNYPSNSLLTFNSIASPEGLVNAVKIVENTNTNIHGISKTSVFPTNASAVVYTISVFAKKNQRDFLQIQTYADSTSINSNGFDLTNGTITGDSTNHKIEDYGNGWYRCSFTVSITQSTGGYNFIRIAIGKVNNSFYYTGDNTSGLYLYGFQFEEGSYATSYIPTYGTSVTRNGEVFEKTGLSGVIGQTEGTLYIEAIFKEEGNLSQWFSLSDGTSNNWVFIGKDNNDIRGYIRANNVVAFSNQTFQIVNNSVVKAALSYESGSISLYINGSLIASSTNSFSFNQPLDEIYSTTFYNTAAREKVNLDRMLLFKTALTDDECIALTTL
jgi:hypothetical protein